MKQKSLASLRSAYAADVTRAAGMFANPRVEAAFEAVPREDYLTPPPWRVFDPHGGDDVVTRDPAKLYADRLVTLDAARGINNGQPSLHAAWMGAVDPAPGERVVQIGIGAGYYTAVLAWLVGSTGGVEAYEIDAHLAAVAGANLAAIGHVHVHAASGVGVELPAADVVYVSAAAAAPDVHWLAALRPEGRLIFPWQPAGWGGSALRVARVELGFRARLLMDVAFMGCVGAGARDVRARPVFPLRHIGETRSVWLAETRAPDASATAVYENVWFSADEV
jgi:protein-L-isoaspartate(D-aspartate) O-methyltransferase